MLAAGTVRLVGRLLRGLIAATVLGALVVGLPWALWHYIGWPLPDHIPTWAEVEGVLLGPMTTTFLLDVLACLCWVTWVAFTIDVGRCTVDVARGLARDGINATRLPILSSTGPMHALAGVLVGAVLLSVLGNRPTPTPATSPATVAAVTRVEATAPTWHTPRHSDKAIGQDTIHGATFVITTSAQVPAGNEPAHPQSVVVRAPENGVHDSLWRIASRTLGDGARWPEIFELNKGKTQPYGHRLTNPSLIFPGEELTLPANATIPPPPDSSLPPAPPEPPATPPPITAPPTTEPPTSAEPSSPETPAPSTQQTPEQTQEQARPTATDTGSPSAAGEPGFRWGPELFVGLGLAAAISAALVVARRRFNSRYRPGSGDRDELPVAPVVYQLHLAHLRAEADYTDPDVDDRDDHSDGRSDHDGDRWGHRSQHVPRSPALVVGAPETGTGVDSDERPGLAAGLGVRDGREIALDLATARGLGLVGDGAPAAARALLVATLSAQDSAYTSPSAGTRVFIPANDLVRTLGRGADHAQLPAAVRVVASLDDALDALEAETLVRATANIEQTTTSSTWPPLVLMAQPAEHQRQRLQAVLDNGAPFGVTGLLLGQWQPGVTVFVRADGTISATSPGLGEVLRGTRMFRLGDNDTVELLTLLRQAEPARPVAAPPAATPAPSRILPTEPAEHHSAISREKEASATRHADESPVGEGTVGEGHAGESDAASRATPRPGTELEVTATIRAPGTADTDLEILCSSPAAAPGGRVRPTVPRQQPAPPHVPEDPTISDEVTANQASDHPAPGGENTTATAKPTSDATAVSQDDRTAGTAIDPAAGTAPMPITITVLGSLRVHWNPTPRTTNSVDHAGGLTASDRVTDSDRQGREITGALQPRTRELLVLLALHPDGVTRDALVSALWGQDPPTRPTNALHTALSRMRHATATATDDTVTDIVVVANGRYQLDPAKVWVDYWRFAQAVTARRTAATDQARLDAYRSVIDSYGGPLAEGLSAEWIEPAREAIRRDAIDAVAALARALVATDPQQTLDLLEVARAFDPHNELLYRDIMRLQERLGQLDAIPRTLNLLTTRLAEVDDTPTPQARALAARLAQRHHDRYDDRHDEASTAPARSVTRREPRRSAAS